MCCSSLYLHCFLVFALLSPVFVSPIVIDHSMQWRKKVRMVLRSNHAGKKWFLFLGGTLGGGSGHCSSLKARSLLAMPEEGEGEGEGGKPGKNFN